MENISKKKLLEILKENNFSQKIISAFSEVKRENFIPEYLKSYAYEDIALPLEKGATISQPYTIAFMLSLLELKNNQKILEIGSGSGYVLSLISKISKQSDTSRFFSRHRNPDIYGIEIIKSLAESSKIILKKYKNISIINKDGSKGLLEHAPFDRILISASAEEIPKNLYSQLKDSGIMVCPVKNSIFQIKKQNSKIKLKEFPGFVFVPLIRTEQNL